nr:hypothetical protein [Bacteroidota bacterium]
MDYNPQNNKERVASPDHWRGWKPWNAQDIRNQGRHPLVPPGLHPFFTSPQQSSFLSLDQAFSTC